MRQRIKTLRWFIRLGRQHERHWSGRHLTWQELWDRAQDCVMMSERNKKETYGITTSSSRGNDKPGQPE